MDPTTYGQLVVLALDLVADDGSCLLYQDEHTGVVQVLEDPAARAERDEVMRRTIAKIVERHTVIAPYRPPSLSWPVVLRTWADQPKTETVFGPVTTDHMGAAAERFRAMVAAGRVRLG